MSIHLRHIYLHILCPILREFHKHVSHPVWHCDFFFNFLFYCSGLCYALKWISHGFTCVPHPDPPSHLPLHPIPLGLPRTLWFFKNNFHLFILFLVALDLCCYKGFSLIGEQGLPFLAAHSLLTVVASLAVEHGSRHSGFSNCSTWAQ